MAATISLAMIVKNEEGQLRDCLKSVQPIIDEFCIVDTGSRDETLLIGREFNAHTTVYLWSDDFSAARNESLRLCTKDWILVLDADERVAPEDLDKLKQACKGRTDICYRLTTRNYTNTESVSDFQVCEPEDPHGKGFKGWYPSTKVRLFPNNRGAKFEGKVHELVNQSLERGGIKVVDSDVPIHHYPLTKTPDSLREKQELYLKLGHEKAKDDPNDPKAYAELGAQYAEVGEHAKAAAAFREAVKLAPSNARYLKDLGGMLHLLKRNDDAQQCLRLAIDLEPGLTEAWRNLGVVLADLKEWQGALECFNKAIQLDPAWPDGLRYVSVALEGAGQLDEAGVYSQRALEARPDSPECLRLFVHQMLRQGRRPHAREVLIHIIDRAGGKPELDNAVGELYFYDKMLDEAKNHFRRAGEQGHAPAYNNLGVIHFQEKNFDAAREAWEMCLALDPGHRGARSNLQKVLPADNANGGAE